MSIQAKWLIEVSSRTGNIGPANAICVVCHYGFVLVQWMQVSVSSKQFLDLLNRSFGDCSIYSAKLL
jgi:hypothetical protein